jgi:hypothetical protein
MIKYNWQRARLNFELGNLMTSIFKKWLKLSKAKAFFRKKFYKKLLENKGKVILTYLRVVSKERKRLK